MSISFSYRIEKEKDTLKREAEDAKSALDGLSRDKVMYTISTTTRTLTKNINQICDVNLIQ